MRVGSLIGRLPNGEWVSLAQGNDVSGMKSAMKDLIRNDGDGGRLAMAVFLSGGIVKRKKFSAMANLAANLAEAAAPVAKPKTRVEELDTLAVPTLREIAKSLEVDPKGVKKAELIAEIVVAENSLAELQVVAAQLQINIEGLKPSEILAAVEKAEAEAAGKDTGTQNTQQ